LTFSNSIWRLFFFFQTLPPSLPCLFARPLAPSYFQFRVVSPRTFFWGLLEYFGHLPQRYPPLEIAPHLYTLPPFFFFFLVTLFSIGLFFPSGVIQFLFFSKNEGFFSPPPHPFVISLYFFFSPLSGYPAPSSFLRPFVSRVLNSHLFPLVFSALFQNFRCFPLKLQFLCFSPLSRFLFFFMSPPFLNPAFLPQLAFPRVKFSLSIALFSSSSSFPPRHFFFSSVVFPLNADFFLIDYSFVLHDFRLLPYADVAFFRSPLDQPSHLFRTISGSPLSVFPALPPFF